MVGHNCFIVQETQSDLWGSSPDYSVCFIPLALVSSIRAILVPNHAITIPIFYDVSSSVPLVVEFTLPIFRLFSGLFTLM